MTTQPFADFLKTHHKATSESLHQEFGEQAFLLVREPGNPPLIVTLDPSGGAIGSAPESAYLAEGLAATHCEIRYHAGFTSWVLVALEQTGVNGTLAPVDRPLVLASRDELRFPTNRVKVQFYSAETLIKRLHTAGATKRMKRPVVTSSAPAVELAETAVTPPEPPAPAPASSSSAEERPSRRMTRAASSHGVSWG